MQFVLFVVIIQTLCVESYIFNKFNLLGNTFKKSHICQPLSAVNSASPKAKLLPDPNPNSIGNFFENKTEETSFIQCYMLALGEVYGDQYGVGFPIDMPVMLTYFEGNELKPVRDDYPDYDHLINHVSVQLENNELLLYKTPVVLTLQGEFEDENMNDIYTPSQQRKKEARYQSSDRFDGYSSSLEEDDEDDDDEAEEVTIEDVIAMEGLDQESDDDDDYDEDEEEEDEEGEEDEEYSEDDDIEYNDENLEAYDDVDLIDEDEDDNDEETDEDEDDKADDSNYVTKKVKKQDKENTNNANLKSFWNSSPAGKNDQQSNIPDISIYRPSTPDLSDIPLDAIVTDEDTRGLKRAHRKADKIIQYADDIKLIASFHYKKRNFHLVKLLEPMFLVGKRIMDIKGYYFTLLNDEDSAKITPMLEKLLINRPKTATSSSSPNKYEDDTAAASRLRSKRGGGTGSNNQVDRDSSGSPSAPRTSSRRRWKDRKLGQ